MYDEIIQLSWRSPPPNTLRRPRKVFTTLETRVITPSTCEVEHLWIRLDSVLGLAKMASALRVGQAFKGMKDTYVGVKQLHSHVWTARSVHTSLPFHHFPLTSRPAVLRTTQELVPSPSRIEDRASKPRKPGERHSTTIHGLPANKTDARPWIGSAVSGPGTPG
jgi:hypothetical protein